MRRSDFIIASFLKRSNTRATWQVLTTLLPIAGLWYLIARIDQASLSAALKIFSLLPVLGLLALFSSRAFSLMHDCGHNSLFRWRWLNRSIGFLLGVLNAIPQHPWSLDHAFHHRHNGDWEIYRGPIDVLKLDSYQELSEKNKFPKSIKNKKKISIVTGELAYDTFVKKVKPIFNNIKNLEVKFYKIKNNFFGDSVTVAGLLTGRDIIEQLKDKDLGDCVWTTYRILNDDQTLTLDDMTLEDISKALGIPLKVSNDSINEVIEKTLNE